MSDFKLKIPIKIVNDEIGSTLKQAAQALESYYEEEKKSKKTGYV